VNEVVEAGIEKQSQNRFGILSGCWELAFFFAQNVANRDDHEV
jgi:hypothetical protein